jgi:hypothetical protein
MRLTSLSLCAAAVLAGCPGRDLPTTDATSTVDVPWVHPDITEDRTGDGLLHVVVVDPIRGEGLPCKLTVRGLDGTPTPAWGRTPGDDQEGEWLDRDNWALGIGRWVLMGRGRADVALAPGRYRLTVTRGGEYAALELGEVRVGPRHGATVGGALRRVVDTEGEIAGEFHVHSAPSFDSDVPLDQRVLSLAVEGVEVFASTDHDALGDFAPAIAALGLAGRIHWIHGDEITADGFGHFGAYPLPDDVDPARDLTHDEPSVARIVARARAVAPSAVIQLNHPLWNPAIGHWAAAGFDPMTGMARGEIFGAFDAVEVWNSHTLDQGAPEYVPVDRVIDAWMAMLQLGRGATAMGNTDTHRLSHTPPGWPRTYLRVPDDDPAHVTDAMVADAIRAGDASLTSGPFLRATIGDVRPGGLARAASGGEVTVRVVLQAPAWTPVDRVEVVVNRRIFVRDVTVTAVDGVLRQAWDVPLALTRDAWVVVRTRAVDPVPDMAGVHAQSLPSLALVNPI